MLKRNMPKFHILHKLSNISSLSNLHYCVQVCMSLQSTSEFPSQHIFLSLLSLWGTPDRPRDVVPCPPNPRADPGRPPSARIRD